jgi:8-oxo-dGTP diphosphatase
VGIAVLIVDPLNHPDAILVGERRGSHGAATFATPGGHLEYGEGFSECGLREVKEETNLDLVAPLRHVYTCNTVFAESRKHYVTLFLKGSISQAAGGSELRTLEPDKCVGWVWLRWDELRRRHRSGELQVFPTLATLLEDETFVL